MNEIKCVSQLILWDAQFSVRARRRAELKQSPCVGAVQLSGNSHDFSIKIQYEEAVKPNHIYYRS